MIQRLKQKAQLGPADHGRRMSYDEFTAGDYLEGYRYELIDGELTVSAAPNMSHNLVERWVGHKLEHYANTHEDVVNFVTNRSRLFVPDREDVTAPEPDVAVYQNVPLDLPDDDLDWRNFSPLLVVEVISPDNAEKDQVRNVELYFQIPSIKEYWLFDPRESSMLPRLTVYRRQAKKWKVIEVAPGDKYTTRLLPGFELVVDRGQ